MAVDLSRFDVPQSTSDLSLPWLTPSKPIDEMAAWLNSKLVTAKAGNSSRPLNLLDMFHASLVQTFFSLELLVFW